MADNDEDLVSEIKVEGAEAAAKEIEFFATDGVNSFGRIGDAAEKASDKVNQSTDKIDKDLKKVRQSAKETGNAAGEVGRLSPVLKQLEQDTAKFTASIPKAAKELTQFTKKVTVLATAAVAAGVGIVAAARNVVNSSASQSSALEKQANAQIDANNAALQGELAQINYNSSLRQLNQQLATGQITYQQYSDQVKQLNQTYREQQRVAREVEEAQKRVKEENDRLTKSIADRKAYEALIDTFGGPLLTALTQLGNVANQTQKKFIDAFGPAAAGVVDAITNVLTKNSGAIGKFFDDASKKIQDLLTKNGPAIEKMLETIGKAAAAVFNGLIDAAPLLLDFFNNVVVPAVESVASALDGLAKLINTVFGTNITGGFLAIVVVLGTMTDAFKALFGVVGVATRALIVLAGVVSASLGVSLGAAIAIIAAVAAALYLLYTNVDWAAWGEKVAAAWAKVVEWFNTAKQAGTAAATGIQSAWNGLVAWFQSVWSGIVTIFGTVWEGVKAGVTATIQFITDAWNTFIGVLQGIVTKITEVWNNGVETIKSYWRAGIDAIKGFFTELYQSALSRLQPIIDMLKQILSLGAGAEGAGGGAAYAGGGHVSGPGTGTSDSIPAWLSNGEFVVKARSVAKYGLGILHAINSGNFKLPGFADGGLVGISPAPVPSFAGVGGGTGEVTLQPLNLSLFGEEFKGLMMPEDVGRRMTKFAINKQTRSAGRKPAWIGRGRT